MLNSKVWKKFRFNSKLLWAWQCNSAAYLTLQDFHLTYDLYNSMMTNSGSYFLYVYMYNVKSMQNELSLVC